MASDRELLRVIKDLKNTVTTLNKNYQEQGLPVTDGSPELQQLCAQLEFLLQYDLKEKRNLFGQRKDYWDFLSRVLTRLHSGVHTGIQHVSSLAKLKTSSGKGRAFIRYCLVHQDLAETLQLCFMEPEVTSEWYYARSPFLDQKLWLDILGSLYELHSLDFHLALHRTDLDVAWPVASEILPQRSNPAAVRIQEMKTLLEIENSNGDCRGTARKKDQHIESRPEDLMPGLEHSVEKWVGIWRSRKNSLLQMGSLLKLNPFSERNVQYSASAKEVQRTNCELQVQMDKPNKEESSYITSPLGLHPLLPQPEHSLRGKMDRLHQRTPEDDNWWKHKDLRTLIWEFGALQQKLCQQEEQNITLSNEKQTLKEELTKCKQQLKKKMDEEEKQQEEMVKVVEALKKAEDKMNKLTNECQEAWAKKDAAERALEEAEQRLSSLEAEKRKHRADIEAQELRQQQLSSRCQGLQEKLKVYEESLEKWETQALALKSQHGHLEATEGQLEQISCRPPEREQHPTMLEWGLLKEKLERSLAEIKLLEKEKENLAEVLLSQEQSLVFTKLEIQDLQTELEVCRQHVHTLQKSQEEQEKALREREEMVQELQRKLNEQSAQLQATLEKNTTLGAQLEEIASIKSRLEGESVKEKTRYDRALQELTNHLAVCEKEVATLQEEKQHLQTTLLHECEEKEALAKQVESVTAALEAQTQEVTRLRFELENWNSNHQALQKALQKSEAVALTLREESLHLKNQVELLEQEKKQAADTAKKLSKELEQSWEWSTEEEGRQMADRDALQADILDGLDSLGKKEDSTKHRTEAQGKCLAARMDKMSHDVQHTKQMLAAKEKTAMHLLEELKRAQQEKEELQLLLKKSHKELEENEKTYKRDLSEQGELIRNMKGKMLELLREKDALWQKTEGIASPTECPPPQNPAVCARCKKDFRLMSRRYQCRLCRCTVCHACSVSSGHRDRCCWPCYQKRNGQAT